MSEIEILQHGTGTIGHAHARTYGSPSTSPNRGPAGIPHGSQTESKSSSWLGISTIVTSEFPGIPQSDKAG